MWLLLVLPQRLPNFKPLLKLNRLKWLLLYLTHLKTLIKVIFLQPLSLLPHIRFDNRKHLQLRCMCLMCLFTCISQTFSFDAVLPRVSAGRLLYCVCEPAYS